MAMNIQEIITTAGGALAAVGGFEAVKWMFNRKSSKRVATAQAEIEEVKADKAQFDFMTSQITYFQNQILVLNEQLSVKDQQMAKKDEQIAVKDEQIARQSEIITKKEERFVEQTELVRRQNTQILDLAKQNESLLAERKLKLCERRNCKERQPQSGY